MLSSERSILNMSPGLKMALFIALTGLCMILGGLISFYIVSAALHIDFNEIQAVILKPEYATITQFANALASIIAFGLPSVAVAYFSDGRIVKNMGFNAVKSIEQIGLVVMIAFVGLILSGALGDLNEKIPIPASFKFRAQQLEEQYKKALVAMTQMKSFVDLFFAIIAVAVVPAIVEELYFRASLQKILMDWTGKPFAAIILTAIIFSVFHFSYFGFLSRMSLGIVLGCIYYFTKTIWLPILMHFINNAMGITALYLFRNDAEKVEKVIDGSLSYYWAIIAIVAVYFLLKKIKNSTEHEGLEKSI